MVDDQIHHDTETDFPSSLEHFTKLVLWRSSSRINQARIKLVIIRDRVEAAGISGLMKRIEKDPIEAHLAGPPQVLCPTRKCSCQKWKKVVDAGSSTIGVGCVHLLLVLLLMGCRFALRKLADSLA